MLLGDTIVARSSPPGRSPRALIRLSGPDAHAALDALASPGSQSPSRTRLGASPRSCRATLGLSAGHRIAALTTRFAAPSSATGEHVAEILIAGNPALVERVIDALILTAPTRMRRASPGEFTARAFMNGKLDLVQAEGIARTISARSEADRLVATRLTSGQTGARVAAWVDALATLLALTEAGIDFSDHEDVIPIAPHDLALRVLRLIAGLESALSANPREHREHRARVVLVGPPNAGKSTLFNALLGRHRAVASPHPGSTRDVLVEPLDLSPDHPAAGTIDLCDLAGLADVADESSESATTTSPLSAPSPSSIAAQRSARAAIDSADALILCSPSADHDSILALLPRAARAKPALRVRTKADLPSAFSLAPALTPASAGEQPEALAVCALDRSHLAELRRAIADLIRDPLAAESDILPRHAAALLSARDTLAQALRLIDPDARSLGAPEVVASSLREALDALGQISGRTTTDDILARVFATFCVGK